MYTGRKLLGQEVAFTVSAVDGLGETSWPGSAPFLDVWKGATLVLSGLKMPKVDPQAVGLFRYKLVLDGRFSVGAYEVVKRWVVGTYRGVQVDRFDVIAGGHADGAIVAMHYHEMPHASFLVQQTDGGRLVRGKNPRA